MSSVNLKHPRALPICFLTEMWERFGYAIIATTMIFILIQRFDLNDSKANIIVGSFSAMLYITSVLAGQVADKLIGYYRSVLLGGVFLIAGYTYLVFASDLFTFCIALGAVCSGTGLLKTNVGSYLGHSYKPEDTHRQSGFTIFYVGINIGGLLGFSTAGYIYNSMGDIAIFVLAAIMILIGTLTFYIGFKKLSLELYRESVSVFQWILAIAISIGGGLASVIVIYNPSISNLFLILIIIFSLFVIFKGAKDPKDLKKAVSYLIFLIVAVAFWALYNQIFMSLNLFIDRVVDHRIFGVNIPTQSFLIFNTSTVLGGGVLLGLLWKKYNLLDIYKYLIGMFILIFMYVTVAVGIHLSGVDTQSLVSGYWVALCYICLGFAELFVSAIGLSLATRLAPRGQIGAYMGLWLVNIGIGGFVAGIIANFAAISDNNINNIIELKHVYLHGFNIYISIAVIAFVITMVATFFIKKLLGDDA
ncbi:peptide MFS transporter [Francisella sp. XLW-1]|uniref:peptide MFS transporter n=1 Tax=Francisella sp. XLW-1 TaxID=2610887 RepID=UPI00123D5A13|nr:oligopeptide:H+ symporter [Francisella sp. XLW-1]